MCAVDLPSTEFRDTLLDRCYDEGMIILGCGDLSVRFRSPLTITQEEIGTGIDLIRKIILQLEDEYQGDRSENGVTESMVDG